MKKKNYYKFKLPRKKKKALKKEMLRLKNNYSDSACGRIYFESQKEKLKNQLFHMYSDLFEKYKLTLPCLT